jgi:hypothetical protein
MKEVGQAMRYQQARDDIESGRVDLGLD